MESLAADFELDYSVQQSAKRNSTEPDAKVVQEVFRLNAPEADGKTRAVLPASDGFAVVELTLVTDGILDGAAIFALQQYERSIANSNANQETAAVLAQLRAAADIEVFEDKIK